MAAVARFPGIAGQIRLVAWLRWRLLRNSLRRKNSRLDLLGLIVSGLLSSLW